MKKEFSFEVTYRQPWSVQRVLSQVMAFLIMVVSPLSKYYGQVMGREVDLKQTLLLIDVQLAFFFAAFCDYTHWSGHVLSLIWFVCGLTACVRGFAEKR